MPSDVRGPALYLLGVTATAARIGRAQGWSRVLIIVFLLAAIPLAAKLSGLAVIAVLAFILCALIVTEQLGSRTRTP